MSTVTNSKIISDQTLDPGKSRPYFWEDKFGFTNTVPNPAPTPLDNSYFLDIRPGVQSADIINGGINTVELEISRQTRRLILTEDSQGGSGSITLQVVFTVTNVGGQTAAFDVHLVTVSP